MQVVGLLQPMGYTRLRHYSGGIADWIRHGLPLESTTDAPAEEAEIGSRSATPMGDTIRQDPAIVSPARSRRMLLAFDWLSSRSVGQLAAAWAGMVAAFGAAYWLASFATGGGLLDAGHPVA